ncbi:NAD(P)/FAD-dependent oxidoreductase [Leptolyngbya sp. GB1-A1]|uniref:NAD(P)/FAD-dependent oxidoreductase n=1 Tax=Leptolyngbya sp. GB1-A1 TaxID=2933908 RepID=UPI0032982003
MAVDYDLVILGGTTVARSVAALACRFQAQVALVEPQPPRGTDNFRMLLSEWANLSYRIEQLPRSQEMPHPARLTSPPELLNLAAQTAPILTETRMIQQQQSLDQLAAAGVDVIVGQGEFHRLPRLGYRVNGRSLSSRAYLLALPGLPIYPAILGLDGATVLTLDALAEFKGETLPKRITILGDDPQAIEFAQILQRLGVQVTLIQSRFLPQFDPQAVRLIQAQLEAEGVSLFTGVSIEQVQTTNSGIRLYGQDASGKAHCIEANLLLLATARRLDLAHLKLEAIGVKWAPDGVTVNRRLQTTHPRVYACGETLGGFALPQLVREEADLVLHNALFLSPRKVQSHLVPRTLFTDPQIAQVGMNQIKARRTYGKAVRILTTSTQTITRAYLQEEMAGFCTLILRQDGKILGATIVSPQASEWISILTLAMQQNLSMAQLAQLPIPSPTFAEMLHALTYTWRYQRLTTGQRTWLDRYFDLRRSWSS